MTQRTPRESFPSGDNLREALPRIRQHLRQMSRTIQQAEQHFASATTIATEKAGGRLWWLPLVAAVAAYLRSLLAAWRECSLASEECRSAARDAQSAITEATYHWQQVYGHSLYSGAIDRDTSYAPQDAELKLGPIPTPPSATELQRVYNNIADLQSRIAEGEGLAKQLRNLTTAAVDAYSPKARVHHAGGAPTLATSHRAPGGRYPVGGRLAIGVLNWWLWRAEVDKNGTSPQSNRVLGLCSSGWSADPEALPIVKVYGRAAEAKGAIPSRKEARRKWQRQVELAARRPQTAPTIGKASIEQRLADRTNYGARRWSRYRNLAAIGPVVGTEWRLVHEDSTPESPCDWRTWWNTAPLPLSLVVIAERWGSGPTGRWLRSILSIPEAKKGLQNGTLPGPRFVACGAPVLWRVIHGVEVYRLDARWIDRNGQPPHEPRNVHSSVCVWRYTERAAGDIVRPSVYHVSPGQTDEAIEAALFSRLAPPSERERLRRLHAEQQAISARQTVRKQRADMLRDLRALPVITPQDSYSAGNCEPGTANFLRAVGLPHASRVTGRELAVRWRRAGWTDETLFRRAITAAADRLARQNRHAVNA